ncbi:alpha/beta hydrolase [Halalkalibacillus halophilus]|uniref:alpha/beta hydrolase n=1 Tax=Halalkalibacillus halophilus TaxID=392827 RepID=UPI00041C9250|nr:alpha/beta hydrolase [Halalkalibacillus halophilus]
MKKLLLFGMLIILVMVACSDDDPESAPEEDPEEESEEEEEEQLASEKFIDDWHGVIQVPNQELEIDITINYDDEEELRGFIHIPAQDLENYPLSELEVDENEISFEMDHPNQYIHFEGELIEDEEVIEGIFNQQSQTFPFNVVRGEREELDEEEAEDEFLSVETNYGELRGELLEVDEEPSPVAIIIPGSGPTDRNGNGAGGNNDSLRMIAEGLAEEGIASLRYSKRGVKENAEALISEQNLRFHHFVSDAISWVDLLEEDDRFTDIYLIGHSQGALVSMLAAEQSNVSKVVSLAGAGRSIDEVLYEQMEEELSGEELAEAESIIEQLKDGQTVSEVSLELHATFRGDIQPFLISWMAHHPNEVVADLQKDLLVIQGGRDLQVSLEDAEQLVEAQPNANYMEFDEMNHVLKDAPESREGNISTYQDPTLPLSEGLIESITEFLLTEES